MNVYKTMVPASEQQHAAGKRYREEDLERTWEQRCKHRDNWCAKQNPLAEMLAKRELYNVIVSA